MKKGFKNKQMVALIDASLAISDGKQYPPGIENDPLWLEVIAEMLHYNQVLEAKMREDKRSIVCKLALYSKRVENIKNYLTDLVDRKGATTNKTTIAKTLMSRNYSISAFKLFQKTILLARTRKYSNRHVPKLREGGK